MKKTLIALAALAAAGVASAQVTLYGRMDLGLVSSTSEVKNQTAAGTVTAKTTTTSLAGAEHSKTTSRLGVTAKDDLGGGITGLLNYEFKINPDASASSAVATTRLANVGIGGAFGQVTVGTFLNAFDTVRTYNPGVRVFTEDMTPHEISGRAENAIAYGGTFGPVKVGAALIGEQKEVKATVGSATATTKDTTQGILGHVGYTHSMFSVLLALGQVTGESTLKDAAGTTTIVTAANDIKKTDIALGADMTFGAFRPFIVAEMVEKKPNTVATNATDNSKDTATGFVLGLGMTFGNVKPWLSLTTSTRDIKNAAGEKSNKVTTAGGEVGVEYAMSGRTSVYGFFNTAEAKDENQIITTTKDTTTDSKLALGLVHKF